MPTAPTTEAPDLESGEDPGSAAAVLARTAEAIRGTPSVVVLFALVAPLSVLPVVGGMLLPGTPSVSFSSRSGSARRPRTPKPPSASDWLCF